MAISHVANQPNIYVSSICTLQISMMLKRGFGHSKTWVLNDQKRVYKDFITGIPSKGLFTI